MTEKVLHEVRFVETDDGYRIDIKGDKEQLKKMGLHHLKHKGFGAGAFFGRRGFRHGPWGRHPMGYWGPPPWACEGYESDESESEKAEE